MAWCGLPLEGDGAMFRSWCTSLSRSCQRSWGVASFSFRKRNSQKTPLSPFLGWLGALGILPTLRGRSLMQCKKASRAPWASEAPAHQPPDLQLQVFQTTGSVPSPARLCAAVSPAPALQPDTLGLPSSGKYLRTLTPS